MKCYKKIILLSLYSLLAASSAQADFSVAVEPAETNSTGTPAELGLGNRKVLVALDKKFSDGSLSVQEQAMLDDREEDKRTLAKNLKAMAPVCGYVIATSSTPSCDKLTPDEIKKAPFTGTGDGKIKIGNEPAKYRYALSVEERKKLEQQVIKIHDKWEK